MTGFEEAKHPRSRMRLLSAWGAMACLALILFGLTTAVPAQERPSTDRHLAELSRYLDRVEIAEPVIYRRLAVYPVLLSRSIDLPGRWLTFDNALSRGILTVSEKGAGSVPTVVVENRSRDEHVFIMGGELLSGGKQTRTVRKDVVLAPGQRLELDVYCVEAHRWEGESKFSSGRALVPSSIQQELRRGTSQDQVWGEVARNNSALKAENATGSLELALKARPVQDELAVVRREIAPKIPRGTVGFIFVDRGRALGAEFFGSEDLARTLLPKLLDSYAVDHVILHRGEPESGGRSDRVAIEFYERVCRALSQRSDSPGSGSGIRTQTSGLLGEGVSMRGTLVHYGVQIEDRIVPRPVPLPRPRIIWPDPERR